MHVYLRFCRISKESPYLGGVHSVDGPDAWSRLGREFIANLVVEDEYVLAASQKQSLALAFAGAMSAHHLLEAPENLQTLASLSCRVAQQRFD